MPRNVSHSRTHKRLPINFKQWPYWGLFAEIARRLTAQGDPISAAGVRMRYNRGNVEIRSMVAAEINRRRNKHNIGIASSDRSSVSTVDTPEASC